MSVNKYQDGPDKRFVRLPFVLEMFTVRKTKLWDMVKKGEFPKPKKLGARTTVWDLDELYAHREKILGGKNE